MINNNGMDFNTNEVLERLIQPYGTNKMQSLKQDLTQMPMSRVIHVWRGLHLDDKIIYDICNEQNLGVIIEKMEFENQNEAGIYICKRQLARPDLTSEYKKYLIGQRYHFESCRNKDAGQNDSKYSVAATLAKELFISAGTVLKYNVYANAVNAVFAQDEDFAKSILSGRIRISHENAIELARLKPEEIRAVAKSACEEKVDHITRSYIRNEVKWSHVQYRNPITRREYTEQKETSRQRPTIRQMPEYDPDSEVNSLCMTIDSWISSIQRVKNSENFPKISHGASLKLMKKLSIIENTINAVQELLVERTNN